MGLRIMKIAQHGKYWPYFDFQSKKKKKFTFRSTAHFFIIFHITAGNAPQSWIGGVYGPPAKQNLPFLIFQNHGDTNPKSVAIPDGRK